MFQGRMEQLVRVSNNDLISGLKRLVQRERTITLEVLLCLIEVERRGLHRERYSSLFAYCTDRLGYSRSAAGRRIAAARCLRDFPKVGTMLAEGRLNLSTVCILARVLDKSNEAAILCSADGCSQDAAEEIAARYGATKCPRERIRPVKSLGPRANSSVGMRSDHSRAGAAPMDRSNRERGTGQDRSTSVLGTTTEGPENVGVRARVRDIDLGTRLDTVSMSRKEAAGDAPARSAGSEIEAKAPAAHDQERHDEVSAEVSEGVSDQVSVAYDIAFRVDSAFRQRLERAQTLLARSHPHVSLAEVFSQALDLFLDKHDPERRTVRRRDRRNRTTENASGALRRPRLDAQAGNDPSTFRSAPPLDTAPDEALANGWPSSPADIGVSTQAPESTNSTPLASTPSESTHPGSTHPGSAPSESTHPGSTPPKSTGARRRSVPLRVRDQVFIRDGFQCTYVGPEGRCPERRGLEIDHRDPVARGGSNEPENLRVLCRAHNRLMAERAFGIGFMQTRIAGTSTAGEELRPELAERAEDRRLDSSEQAAKTGGRT